MNVLRVLRGILGVGLGGGMVWAGITDQPQVHDQKQYAIGAGAFVMAFGLWRIKKAFESDDKA